MRFEINSERLKARIREWRLWLARKIAPWGADIHDPDETACPVYLHALDGVFRGQVEERDGKEWLDFTSELDEAYGRGLIVRDATTRLWKLTAAGQRSLARLWGVEFVPPWATKRLRSCATHGRYEQRPGDRKGCPGCALQRAVVRSVVG